MVCLIELLLPVTQNLDQRILDTVRSELTTGFGGVTLHLISPAEGLWDNNGDLERDNIVVVEVMRTISTGRGGHSTAENSSDGFHKNTSLFAPRELSGFNDSREGYNRRPISLG
jgi:hypothetical protein